MAAAAAAQQQAQQQAVAAQQAQAQAQAQQAALQQQLLQQHAQQQVAAAAAAAAAALPAPPGFDDLGLVSPGGGRPKAAAAAGPSGVPGLFIPKSSSLYVKNLPADADKCFLYERFGGCLLEGGAFRGRARVFWGGGAAVGRSGRPAVRRRHSPL
jgi:hypothetical protein